LAVQPDESQTLLIVTYAAMRPFTPEDDAHWQQVKASLVLTEHSEQ
jgi:hypothetical protein